MKVYVIRHGQSETNVKNRWTGWLDVSLTDKGRNDAKRAGELIKGIDFDKIYTSDLTRAIETAQNALPGCCPEKSRLLREVNVGSIANKPLDILTDTQRERIHKDGYVEFDGESRTEFYDRVCEFKSRLEMLDAENVAVFSHAGWLCGMLDTVLGVRIPRKNISCNNCTVAIFEYHNQAWRLDSWINL